MLLLAALQLAAATPTSPPARIDLLAPTVPSCPADVGGDDVVVCARRGREQFRLKPLPDRAVSAPPRAATRLGPGELSATVDQVAMPNGEISKRAMLNLRIPF